MPSQEYDPRTGQNVPDQVETQSEQTVGGTAQPLEGVQLAGHDGIVYLPVSARLINGRVHLFTRDEALLDAVSQLTLAIHQLLGVLGDDNE